MKRQPKVERREVHALRHVQLELTHDTLTLPDLAGAIVKIVVRAPVGVDVDAPALRQRALEVGATFCFPVQVLRVGGTERRVERKIAELRDPVVALRRYSESCPIPPGAADPFALLGELCESNG